MVFRASDLLVSAVREKGAREYALKTCACCDTIQTCKSCTKTSPPSTCRPPSLACGGTLTVSLSTFKMLQAQLDTVLKEFMLASGARKPGGKKGKGKSRKKK